MTPLPHASMYEEEKKDCSNSEMSEDQEKEEPAAASQPVNADTDPVDEREPDSESEGSSSDSDEDGDDVPAEALPDGDTNDDLHALLAYSKNRLEQAASAEQAEKPPEIEDGVEEDHEEDEDQPGIDDASGAETGATDEHDAGAVPAESGAGEDQVIVPTRDESSDEEQTESSVIEGKSDEELLKLAEEKVRLAEEKARLDDADETEEKAAEEPSARRNENSELWALLNYSKMRLETGATPSLGKKPAGKDDQSVSSKLSKTSRTSKRSLGSKSATNSVTVEGGPAVSPLNGDGDKPDVPFPDVTDGGNVSVDGSVSLESKNDEDEDEDEDESDEESSEDEDGEDELPR